MERSKPIRRIKDPTLSRARQMLTRFLRSYATMPHMPSPGIDKMSALSGVMGFCVELGAIDERQCECLIDWLGDMGAI